MEVAEAEDREEDGEEEEGEGAVPPPSAASPPLPPPEIRPCTLASTWAGLFMRTATASRAGARAASPAMAAASLRTPGRGYTDAASYAAIMAEPSSVRAARQQAAGRQQSSAIACRERRRSDTKRQEGAEEPLPGCSKCSSTCEGTASCGVHARSAGYTQAGAGRASYKVPETVTGLRGMTCMGSHLPAGQAKK